MGVEDENLVSIGGVRTMGPRPGAWDIKPGGELPEGYERVDDFAP